MLRTREDLGLASHVTVKTGDYLRFDVRGRLLEVTDYLSNGLGTLYRCEGENAFRRFFF